MIEGARKQRKVDRHHRLMQPNGDQEKRGRTIWTEAQARRLIKAALKSGLHIAGFKPDGTIIVYEDENPFVPVDRDGSSLTFSDAIRWSDDQG